MSDQGSVGVPPASSSLEKSGQDGHAPGHAPFYDPSAETLTSKHKLPHWNQDHCQCMVTWRLDDAMPADLLATWKSERELWQKAHPEPWDETTEKEYHRRFSDRIDDWLDAGHGECLLKQPEIRKIVADALEYFDGSRYQLTSYVIMPNHVHVLLCLKAEHPLAEILHSWKSFTAKAINKVLNRKGTLWQPEYWDRLIRSQRHLNASLAYIRDNPAKAKLAVGSYTWSVGVSPASSSSKKSGQDGLAPLRNTLSREEDLNE